MALNKKLIVLSGVGLVFAGVGAGVIGYKASQVADGQKQMDDSKASMGGQLSFGLASPMATMAATASDDFMDGINKKVATDVFTKGKISYVNLSDQIQGDLITGISHSVPAMKADGSFVSATPTPPTTNVGDPQFALKTMLNGNLIGGGAAKIAGLSNGKLTENAVKGMFQQSDFEVPNLKAADIRRLLNNDLSQDRLVKLFPGLNSEGLKDKVTEIHDAIKNATVISLNVGIEDIIEAASGGVDFSTLVTNTFVKPAVPNLSTLMGSLQKGGAEVMKSAINAVGNLNGALSAIRRLNPTAQIALGTLGTYGVDAIDAQLSQINSALMVAAFTQDIKSGVVTVAPIDPVAKLIKSLPTLTTADESLQDIYGVDETHQAVGKLFKIMMFTADPNNMKTFVGKLVANGVDPTKATNAEKITAFTGVVADLTTQAKGLVTLFTTNVTDANVQKVVFDGATDDLAKAQKIQAWMKTDDGKTFAAAVAAAQAAKTAGTGGKP